MDDKGIAIALEVTQVAHCHVDATYAVGDRAFGRAVLYLLLYFVFALYERKNEIRIK
jgi:hypothetical protein